MSVDNFNDLIEEAARRHNVDPNLIKAVMHIESRGNPRAFNRESQAAGLMQIIPGTARRLGVTDPYDPAQSIDAGARHLAESLNRHGDPSKAILEYHGGRRQANWGPRTRAYLENVMNRFNEISQPQDPQAGNQVPTQPAAPVGNAQPTSQPGQTQTSQTAQDPIEMFLTGAGQESAVAPTVRGPRIISQASASENTPQASTVPGPRAIPDGMADDPIGQFLFGVQNETQRPDPTTGQIPPPRRQTSAGERFGAGLGRGLRDVVDAPAEFLSNQAEKSGLTGYLRDSSFGRFLERAGVPITSGQQTREGNLEERRNFERDFGDSGMALAGRVGGQVAGVLGPLKAGGAVIRGAGSIVGATAPTLTAPIAPAAQALAGTASPANPFLRFGARATTGAAQGAATTAMTLDPTQDTGTQMAIGTGAGAVGSAVLAPAISAGANSMRQFLSPSLNPQVAALAQRAETLGVPVRGSQISESPFIKWLDETLNNIPGSGQVARNAEQRSQFTRAVSKAIGENTDAITRDTLQAAERRIGGTMGDIAKRTTLRTDQQFTDALQKIDDELLRMPLPDGSAKALARQLEDVRSATSSGTMSGEAYQAFTRYGTPLSMAQRSPDPNIRHFAGQVRDALDDMLERSAAPELVDGLRQARSQWRAMVNVVEPMIEKSPNGQIDPAALLTRIRAAYPDFLRRGTGGNELGELAMIGAQFMPRMPNSGSAQRVAIGAGIANTGAYLLDPSMLATGLGVTAGTAAVGRGTGALLASDVYRDMLLGRGIPGAVGRGIDEVGAGANRLFQAGGVPAMSSAARQDWANEPLPMPEPNGQVIEIFPPRR
jgi:hypothetical protein